MSTVIKAIKILITNPFLFVSQMALHFRGLIKNESMYLKIVFRGWCGYKLDLVKPKTYNQKLQWLKLYDRNPIYTMLVDKYSVKDYVKTKIGSQYVIPTLGVWDSPYDIDWDVLPPKFVLKTTNGGGAQGVIICKDKKVLDKEIAMNKLAKSLEQDLYRDLVEWPYKNVRKRIIAEELLDGENGKAPNDYKIYCFNGEPKVLLIATERFSVNHAYFDYFDMDGSHLPFTQGDANNPTTPEIPSTFSIMKQLASKLSQGFPHVRVDFYSIGNSVYFGELTFFDSSGFAPFEPMEWDYIWGDWITLPSKKQKS